MVSKSINKGERQCEVSPSPWIWYGIHSWSDQSEEEIPLNMVTFVCEGGDFTKVVRAYRKVRRLNPNMELLIWVDYDRYARDDRGDYDKYRNKDSDIPDFLFTTMNFEDFLSLHFETQKLAEWIEVCTKRNHFYAPMTASEYMEPFMEIIGTSYHKGDMPFELTTYRLENLRRNLADPSVGFGCDFAQVFLSHVELSKYANNV